MWRVPRIGPKGISVRLRRACGVAFGLTFGTHGMFRRKDRRVCFEGVSKGAFGEMASGTGGILRRTVRQGFRRKLRRGHSAGLRKGFEDGRGLSGTRGTLRRGV